MPSEHPNPAATHKNSDRLVRPPQPMSDLVRTALVRRDLVDQYQARPAYQRNDYLMWINKAKLEVTKQKRIAQMLAELRSDDAYMGMTWRAADLSIGRSAGRAKA